MGKEKKEIGMEKEIELNIKLHNLFKEYIENYGGDAKSADGLDYVVIDDGQAFLYGQRTYLYETLISKKFGMVKWLVDNDKIDRDKSKIITAKTEIVLGMNFTDVFVITKRYWLYEQLLMLLAIQDEPINFLISILE